MELSQIPAMLAKAMEWMAVVVFDDILVIHDKKLASLYMKNWQEHFQHSEVYVWRGR